MSDVDEPTEDQIQVEMEWRGEEEFEHREFDCCHNPACPPGEHDRAMAATAKRDEREAGRIAPTRTINDANEQLKARTLWPEMTIRPPAVEFPELAQDATGAPRNLRDILFSHRALATATAVEITELQREVMRWYYGPGPQAQVLADARQQRDNARGQDQLFNEHRAYDRPSIREAQWLAANPGLATLLEAVDRG